MLVVFERKVLRKILGTIKENSQWHILYNSEIRQQYRGYGVVMEFIKIQRFRRAGHLTNW